MEYHGELVSLSDPKVKIKQLLQRLMAKDMEIKGLESELQETKKSLEASEERYTALKNKGKPKPKAKQVIAKRTYTPEQLEKLRENMANARKRREEKVKTTLL